MRANNDSSFQTAVTCDVGTRVVRVGGELDLASCEQLAQVCLAGAESRVFVDMNALKFMDCSGYSRLLGVRGQLQAMGRSLTLCGAVGQPARLLQLIDRLDHQPID